MNISKNICSTFIHKNIISNDSQYLLLVQGTNAILFLLYPTIKKLNKYQFDNTISYIEFSESSKYFIVIIEKNNECYIKSCLNYAFNIKISQPAFELKGAKISPNDQNLLACTVTNILNIYNLSTIENKEEQESQIHYIKYNTLNKGCKFTEDGEFLGIIERKNCKDYFAIYYSLDYELVSYFPINTTDADDFCWTKDNINIIIWEKMNSRLFIYSLVGSLLNNNNEGLCGINNVKISPNGHFITCQYIDEKIGVFHYMNYNLCNLIEPFNINLEEENLENSFIKKFFNLSTIILYEEGNIFNKIKNTDNNYVEFVMGMQGVYNKINKKKGEDNEKIKDFVYSFDSNYLYFTNKKFSNVLYIYNVFSFLFEYIIIFKNKIDTFNVSPNNNQICILCENDEDSLYIFDFKQINKVTLPKKSSKDYADKVNKSIFYSNDDKTIIIKPDKYNFYILNNNTDI